ncbi:MAG: hypothetical protein ACJA1L_001410, partial [Paracoccaceae bacterium]
CLVQRGFDAVSHEAVLWMNKLVSAPYTTECESPMHDEMWQQHD